MTKTEPMNSYKIKRFVEDELQRPYPSVDPDLLEVTDTSEEAFYSILEIVLVSIKEQHSPRDLTSVGKGLTSVMYGLANECVDCADEPITPLDAFKIVTGAITRHPTYAFELMDSFERAMAADRALRATGIEDKAYRFTPALVEKLSRSDDAESIECLMSTAMSTLPEGGSLPEGDVSKLLDDGVARASQPEVDIVSPDYINSLVDSLGPEEAARRYVDQLGIFNVLPKGNRAKSEDSISISHNNGSTSGITHKISWKEGMSRSIKEFCYALGIEVGVGGSKAAKHFAIQLGIKK